MKALIFLSSLTAIGSSILGRWLGMLDDSYAVGDAWFIGVLAGLISLLLLIDSQTMTKNYIVSLSTILGILWVGFIYFPAAFINILLSITLDKQKKEDLHVRWKKFHLILRRESVWIYLYGLISYLQSQVRQVS